MFKATLLSVRVENKVTKSALGTKEMILGGMMAVQAWGFDF